MARIRHIAITTDDPVKTSDFYKKHFGLTELYRQPKDTGEMGVWLSDGYIYFAVLKHGEADLPKLGVGQTVDMRGIHHIGFLVDDEAATVKSLEDDHVPPVPEFIDPTVRPMAHVTKAKNNKFLGPDEVQFDVRSRGWNEAIAQAMQLYELKPVEKKTKSA